jgi:hypothetical protein
MQILEKSTAVYQSQRIPVGVQILLLISSILLLIVGSSLYLGLDPVQSHWPWPLKPFNTKFLGAIYLTSCLTSGVALLHRRWSSTRLVLPMLALFTTVVTLMSALNLLYFAAPRRVVGLWWFLYVADSVGGSYCVWRYWDRIKRTYALAQHPLWSYVRAKGWILLAYGVGLVVLPTVFAGFWPWQIDALQGRMYGAVFMAGGLGLLWLGSTAIEWMVVGLMQLSFGGLTIFGTLSVNAAVNKIDWSFPGVWVWFAAFLELTIAGLFMVWQALHIPVRTSQK